MQTARHAINSRLSMNDVHTEWNSVVTIPSVQCHLETKLLVVAR